MDKFFVGNGMTQAAIGVWRCVVSKAYRAVVRASLRSCESVSLRVLLSE